MNLHGCIPIGFLHSGQEQGTCFVITDIYYSEKMNKINSNKKIILKHFNQYFYYNPNYSNLFSFLRK